MGQVNLKPCTCTEVCGDGVHFYEREIVGRGLYSWSIKYNFLLLSTGYLSVSVQFTSRYSQSSTY